MDPLERGTGSALPRPRATSRIPPPTPAAAASTHLSEISSSESNTRINSKMLPPPKPAERKSLIERGREATRTTATPSSNLFQTPATGRSKSALGSRPPVSGLSASYGSASVSRPGSSMSNRTSTGNATIGRGTSRPASAQGSYDAIKKKSKKSGAVGELEDAREEIARLEEMLMLAQEEAQKAAELKHRLMESEGARVKSETEKTILQQQLEESRQVNNSFDVERQRLKLESEFAIKDVKRDLEVLEKTKHFEIETASSRFREQISGLERKHEIEVDEFRRKYEREMDELKRRANEQLQIMEQEHKRQSEELERRLTKELEDERMARANEVASLKAEAQTEVQRLMHEMGTSGDQIRQLRNEIKDLEIDLQQQKMTNQSLMGKLAEAAQNALTMESSSSALRAKIDLLQSDGYNQAQGMASLEHQLREAITEAKTLKEKLRAEESVRRKLHNQVQELKGNIRVFCRVRPTLGDETNPAGMSFPDGASDGSQIEIQGADEKTSMGTVVTKTHPFSFDKVFGPTARNEDIFEEISQLVQSALDGFNVCIFAYGQTGSGKTHTMSSQDGMIPRAVHMIYETANALKESGWNYTMEGNFLEVYNENINDLLGRADDLDKKKHEIRHDPKEMKTIVTDVTSIVLDSASQLDQMLRRAAANRTVAATKANERSSRSHSVFILKLHGENTVTGERSSGTLNLVDLAGSERLSHSQASGDRLKETQNINKSLSCLGDVIGALGSANGKESHIPYRNSKLTYLLQYSLGGNSKTLMFVMVSPLQAHLNETITSLKFATKVANTHIGTAKKVKVKRDSDV